MTLQKKMQKKREKYIARHAYARGPGRLVTLAVQGDHVTGDPLLSTMPTEREQVGKLLAHLLATQSLFV